MMMTTVIWFVREEETKKHEQTNKPKTTNQKPTFVVCRIVERDGLPRAHELQRGELLLCGRRRHEAGQEQGGAGRHRKSVCRCFFFTCSRIFRRGHTVLYINVQLGSSINTVQY